MLPWRYGHVYVGSSFAEPGAGTFRLKLEEQR